MVFTVLLEWATALYKSPSGRLHAFFCANKFHLSRVCSRKYDWFTLLPCDAMRCTVLVIGSRALSFSDPYIHFACLSVLVSVILSFCLSATSELNISETRPDRGMVTMDGLYKLAYGLSIGHTPDNVT